MATSRALLALLMSGVTAAVLAHLAREDVALLRREADVALLRPDVAVALLAMGIGAAVATWYALTALGQLALALRSGHGAWSRWLQTAVSRWGAPMLRSAVLTGTGVSLALVALPSHAAVSARAEAPAASPVVEINPTPPAPLGDDLRPGAPIEDAGGQTSSEVPESEPTETEAMEPEPTKTAPSDETEPAGPASGGSAGEAASAQTAPDQPYTVRSGDSLWHIAATELGPRADEAAISAHWQQWYRANASLVGPDPDIIHPGQELLAPIEEES